MSDETTRHGLWVRFDGQNWPAVSEELGEIEHVLRYGTPTRGQLLAAAAVLAAYGTLVRTSARRRAEVVARVREASANPSEAAGGGKARQRHSPTGGEE